MKRSLVLLIIALAGSALGQRPDYEGPTILSRGVGPVLLGGAEFVRIRPYLSVNGIYDTGLTPVSVDQQGQVPEKDLYGLEGQFGVGGYHNWRRTILGVDYRGTYRHYSQDTYYNSSDHSLSLGVTHQSSRSLVVSFRQAAGMHSRAFAPFGGIGFYDQNFAGVPANELFDGRTYYFSSMGDLTYLKGSRLSFNIGGSGLGVRRRSRQLTGVTGVSARGDMAYQLSPSSAIGLDYGFTHFAYTNSFGTSDIHSLAFNYAARLGRRWHFGVRAGASRIETLGLRRVALDPIVAAIIGASTGVEAFHRINYLPRGNASLSRSFERSTFSLGYSLGAGYGNGVYLTSQQQSVHAGYSYTASRRWSVSLSTNYDTIGSLSQNIGRYRSYAGGGGVSCRLTSIVHLVTRAEARQYEANGTQFQRTTFRATVGLAFSPGDIPLSLW